jgi:hypothetical protein
MLGLVVGSLGTMSAWPLCGFAVTFAIFAIP